MSGLESEFPGAVRGENVDCTTPKGLAAVQELGFESHGIAIRNLAGEVLWKQADHTVDMAHVRNALQGLLEE